MLCNQTPFRTGQPWWCRAPTPLLKKKQVSVIRKGNDQDFHENRNGIRRINAISILGKCCLSSILSILRYNALLQYNTSFGKKEGVKDMDALLGYNINSHDASSSSTATSDDKADDVVDDDIVELQNKNKLLMKSDCDSFGIPVEIVQEEKDANETVSWDDPEPPIIMKVIMKQQAMNDGANCLPIPSRRKDDDWILSNTIDIPVSSSVSSSALLEEEKPLSFRIDSDRISIPNPSWMKQIIYHC